MPRARRFNDEVFLETYHSSKSISEVARKMRTNILTARSYAIRLNLPTNLRDSSPIERPSKDILAFRSIKGVGSIASLKRNSPFIYDSNPAFQRRLRRAINWIFDPAHSEQEQFPCELLCIKPPPGRTHLVKVINAVWDDPTLMNKEPIFISEQTGLHESEFIGYLNACWNQGHPPTPITEELL